MTAVKLDGKAMAERVRATIRTRVASARSAVRLDAVLVGEDRSALLYAENQARDCANVGIEYHLHRLDADARFDDIAGRVLLLNADDAVHAIMLHLPLPQEVEAESLQTLIDPDKDVEGVNPSNIGRVLYGRRSLVPCTALAALEMIESTAITLRGARCVIIGASNLVGKPLAVLLMREEATVISTNKFTPELPALCRSADVLVAAAGVAGLVTTEWVKPGALVIDVGINRVVGSDGKTRTVGDVAPEVAEIAGWISPVPGGVGPMTVAMLLRNTLDAARA
ncbi:MAG: bifunctional 5,10-methylenetetrahydrofolate dehydrogenase/5,10-methenyltetrahydrofolate cyclohydrolase [Planctomycetota bacterium]|nr:bifunctional 5,10-methylenetetrahydrofolate dehydrogenase/5,10-methenyltetrahydrofolate cyclohydrolase [Planctomycetota bacterium]